MRSVRVLRNVVTNHFRFFLAGLIGFILTPVLVHALGDGDDGLWVAAFSLTGYLGLFDQGIRPSLLRYLARDHARGALTRGAARTLSSAVALYGALGAVTLVVTVLAAAAFTRFLRIEPAQVDEARHVILIAGLSVSPGTAVPLVLVGGVVTMAYTCHALRLPLARYAWQGFGRPGLVTLGFLAPALALRVLWHPADWWALGAAVAGPWLLFVIIAWGFGLDDGERRHWGRRVPGLFDRKAAEADAGR